MGGLKAVPLLQEKGGESQGSGEGGAGTAVEEMIAGMWSEGLRLEEVGMKESFFELGGHSLLATQIISRIGEALGVELALRELFEAPTVEELARRVEEGTQGKGRGEPGPVLRVMKVAVGPMSF